MRACVCVHVSMRACVRALPHARAGARRRRTSPVAALTSYRHSSVAGMLRKSGERLEPPSSKEKGSAEPHSPRNEPGAS